MPIKLTKVGHFLQLCPLTPHRLHFGGRLDLCIGAEVLLALTPPSLGYLILLAGGLPGAL